MSTKNNNKGGLPKDKMKIALIGSIIIVIIIVSISVASFYIGKKEVAEQQSPIPVIDLSKVSTSNYQKVLGAKTYNWSGKVSKVDGSKIVFTTQIKGENDALETKQITAIINSNTQLIKWDLTKPPAPDQPDSNKEFISSTQLKPGQQIVVKANDDINGRDEVEASSISLLITPTSK